MTNFTIPSITGSNPGSQTKSEDQKEGSIKIQQLATGLLEKSQSAAPQSPLMDRAEAIKTSDSKGVKVVNCAKKYIDHVNHITSGSIITNDFYELFSNKPVTSASYQLLVKQKHEAVRDGSLFPQDKTPLHMNCWEFCFLALADAGVLTDEHIGKVCGMVHHTVQAFQPEKAIEITEHNLKDVQPGDMLFFRNELDLCIEVPAHAAISMGGNKFIENRGEGINEKTFNVGPPKQTFEEYLAERTLAWKVAEARVIKAGYSTAEEIEDGRMSPEEWKERCEEEFADIQNGKGPVRKVFYLPLNQVKDNVEQFIDKSEKARGT